MHIKRGGVIYLCVTYLEYLNPTNTTYNRPNNNQLITYYIQVRYLLRIQQYTVNTTYNIALLVKIMKKKHFFNSLKIIIFLTDKLRVAINCSPKYISWSL